MFFTKYPTSPFSKNLLNLHLSSNCLNPFSGSNPSDGKPTKRPPFHHGVMLKPGGISSPWDSMGLKNGKWLSGDFVHIQVFFKQKGKVFKQTKQTIWWLNQPVWKICSSNWIISPFLGWTFQTYLKPPPRTTFFWVFFSMGLCAYGIPFTKKYTCRSNGLFCEPGLGIFRMHGELYTRGAPQTYMGLEVFMVNNLVFRWPKPLFFMVLGAHGIWSLNEWLNFLWQMMVHIQSSHGS